MRGIIRDTAKKVMADMSEAERAMVRGLVRTTDTSESLSLVMTNIEKEKEARGLMQGTATTWRDHVFTATQLQTMTFEPAKVIIEGILIEGLTLLCGKPKFGKSWLALEIAIGVATGGTCLGGRQCREGAVLYAACEDSRRRLQSRMTKLSGYSDATNWPDRLTLTTSWERLDKGGVSHIEEWINETPEASLIILDTLASVKPVRNNAGYQEDYSALEGLHRLANDRGIAVLILHHLRKSEADDPIDTISGTLGLAGCVDTPIVMQNTNKGKTLYIRGRDIEEAEHAIEFDKETCRWSVRGLADEVHRSETRERILEALKDATTYLGPAEIAPLAVITETVCRKRLAYMLKAGEVIRQGYGHYRHPDNSELDHKPGGEVSHPSQRHSKNKKRTETRR